MTEIIVALVVGAFSLIGTYLSNRKGQALMAYQIEQLEEKVNKHNNLVERMYKLEENYSLTGEKIKAINHRIEDLEKGD